MLQSIFFKTAVNAVRTLKAIAPIYYPGRTAMELNRYMVGIFEVTSTRSWRRSCDGRPGVSG